jgi:NTP pyrophosphatase (non-canonical NTP hydrolase)
MDVNSFDEQAFMDFNHYQFRSGLTAKYPDERAIEYLVLGLASEAGEVAGKYKKIIRDKAGIITDEAKQDMAAEIGDVLWYCAQLAKCLDTNLSVIAIDNLKKLESRLERGKIGGSGDKR